MDNKFPNGNDDEMNTESSNEEVVLFTKNEDEVLETAEAELENAVEEEPEAKPENIEEASNEPLPEKKAVVAPAKTKSEKTQAILFFVIIGIGILAFVVLLVVGIFKLSQEKGWFDKQGNESKPVETVAETGGEDNSGEAETQDYSLYLNDNGSIKDINVKDYVNLCDYKNIVIAYADIKPEDSKIQEELDKILASFEALDKESDTVTKLGDKVNIDYVGTVDGVAFEGGDTKGRGADLTLGSHSYIDDFEDQLVGYKAGDKVTVNVTFPENYGKEDLNGKDAVFEVTINGIYTIPELTDIFVKENLSDYASSVDEMKAYIEKQLAENNKKTYIWDYVKKNSEIATYPEEYLQHENTIYGYELENQYKYYDEYYYTSYGSHMWSDIYAFYETDEAGYNDMVKNYAEDSVKTSLIIQAVAEDAGIEATDADVMNYLTGLGYDSSSYDSIIEKYGKGYIFQNTLSSMIEKKLMEEATVNE